MVRHVVARQKISAVRHCTNCLFAGILEKQLCRRASLGQFQSFTAPRKRMDIMDIYSAWFDLKPGVGDLEFCERLGSYMDSLKAGGQMQDWRLTRRKLGLGPSSLGDFHLM